MLKKTKLIALSIILIFGITGAYIIAFRHSYGTWNPFALPDRIDCFGRRYLPTNEEVNIKYSFTLRQINCCPFLIGKKVFSYSSSYPAGSSPFEIYVQLANGHYLRYQRCGGP